MPTDAEGNENLRTRPNEPLMNPRTILLVLSVLPIVPLTFPTAIVRMETACTPFEPAHMARFRTLRATPARQFSVSWYLTRKRAVHLVVLAGLNVPVGNVTSH